MKVVPRCGSGAAESTLHVHLMMSWVTASIECGITVP
jgi:hypothetical protein